MGEGTFFYKREVNRSLLREGFAIEINRLNIFTDRMGELNRGDRRKITLIFDNKEYEVSMQNLNNKDRKSDSYQIRYSPNGELCRAFQETFYRSYHYIQEIEKMNTVQEKGRKLFIKIPDEYKEYLVIYTTLDPNIYLCEAIVADDLSVLREIASRQTERVFEAEFNYDVVDDTAGINLRTEIVKIRKFNKKIGDSLKEHYAYRCQICGAYIGERYGSHIVETHHIDYFVESLNNDLENLLIVCPNHHSIIHDKNPRFDKKKCIYTYPNGFKEGLILNDHLGRV